jgi:hypothetical protein
MVERQNIQRIQQVLRREPTDLNIVPYMRSPPHTLEPVKLGPWDNQGGWSDCWHPGTWHNEWHPTWHNAASAERGYTSLILSDFVRIREDGFIFNKKNHIIFSSDAETIAFLNSVAMKPIAEVAESHPKVVELLRLD